MFNQLHSDIQKAVVAAIHDPDFQFDLPNLSDDSWEPLLSSNSPHGERLEFVGDGLMHSVIGVELYKLFPLESPHFYTIIRSSVNSNATFAHLMAKVGAHELGSNNKGAADAFEMCIAAYHMEHDFETLCLWVSNRFRPLMMAAAGVFDSFRQREASSSRPLSKHEPGRHVKRKMANVAFYTKAQKPRKHKTLVRYKLKQQKKQLLRHSRTPGAPRARALATTIPKLFATPRPTNHQALLPVHPESVAKMRTIIDLTLDSDSEKEQTDDDDEVTSSTDDMTSVVGRPQLMTMNPLMTTASSFRPSRQFVRVHRVPSHKSSYSWSSVTNAASQLSVTSRTPTPNKSAPHNGLLAESGQVVGTLTNPIIVEESDDDSDWYSSDFAIL